jgi:hypothetical protein
MTYRATFFEPGCAVCDKPPGYIIAIILSLLRKICHTTLFIILITTSSDTLPCSVCNLAGIKRMVPTTIVLIISDEIFLFKLGSILQDQNSQQKIKYKNSTFQCLVGSRRMIVSYLLTQLPVNKVGFKRERF